MKKLLFVVDNMAFGGVSNALIETLKRLDLVGTEIDLLVLHQTGEVLNKIPDKINVIFGSSLYNIIDQRLDVLLKNKDWIKLFKKVIIAFLLKSQLILPVLKYERKKLLSQHYDVEIAYKDGFCTIFSSISKADKKIAWIHNDYKIFTGSNRYKTLFRKSLMAMDSIIAVSNTAGDSLQQTYQLDRRPEIISNPVDSKTILEASNKFIPDYDRQSFNFVSVGRLTDQKGYDRLINVHKLLLRGGHFHRIYIVGAGEDEAILKQQIKQLNVEETFILLGYQSNPYPFIKAADCYVMSSRHEASPLVIIESLILHVPVISTEVADIRERLGNDFGLVVENSEVALYKGMKYILCNDSQLKRFENYLTDYVYDNGVIISKIAAVVGGDLRNDESSTVQE